MLRGLSDLFRDFKNEKPRCLSAFVNLKGVANAGRQRTYSVVTGNKDILTISRVLLRCFGQELIFGFHFIHLLCAGILEWLISFHLTFRVTLKYRVLLT